jgi:hypothetical protein
LKTGELIQANCRITVLELSQEVGISVGSVEEILHKLVVSKVSARWVPWFLRTEHGERLLVAITQILQQYKRGGVEFLDSVVTSHETWVCYFTPESKEQISSGNTSILHPQKKVQTIFSARMIIATVFWD